MTANDDHGLLILFMWFMVGGARCGKSHGASLYGRDLSILLLEAVLRGLTD